MACDTSCGNANIQKGIDKVRALIASGKLEITPVVINNDIRLLGGSVTTMAAPVEIASSAVICPYGNAYHVFPLRMRVCGDGTYTRHIDWRGLEPGVTNITDKGFLLVTANREITDKMAANPLDLVVNAGVLDIRYLGGRDAEWEERDGKVVRKNRADTSEPDPGLAAVLARDGPGEQEAAAAQAEAAMALSTGKEAAAALSWLDRLRARLGGR